MIANEQLETWASAPSPTEMKKIQNARSVIESILKRNFPVDDIKQKYGLSDFKYEVYLQGSYANSTNVRFDSDVDIVVQLNNPFFKDLSQISIEEKHVFESCHQDSGYKFFNFKTDVFDALKLELTDNQVHWSDKCLKVDENTNRVKADVVPCLQYRLYKRFISLDRNSFVEGMKFLNTADNSEITNFPKIHLINCESKNTDTGGKFKDVVRIYKNIRNNLIGNSIINDKIAPSYFIENLLYNCSSPCFDGSYQECMIKTLQFIFDAIQSGRITGFICANEQDTLISQKTWNLADAIGFMSKLADYYINN